MPTPEQERPVSTEQQLKQPSFEERLRDLMEVETELFQCYRDLRSRTSHITPQMVKAHYFGEDINEFTLKNLFEYHNTHNAHSLCKTTQG